MEHSDAVVVGAGVVGCATAFWLARAGLGVTVIERDAPARHASAGAASLLAPAGDALSSGPLAAAGWASLELLQEIEDELEEVSAFEPRIRASGLLRLAGEAEREALRGRLGDLAPYDFSWLDRRDLEDWDARIDAAMVGGLWSPREGYTDGALLTRAFAQGAEHFGARFALAESAVGLAVAQGCVAGVLLDGGELAPAGEVVLCLGAWSRLASAWLDWEVPVDPWRGQWLALSAPSPNLPAPVCARGAVAVPSPDAGLLWAGVEQVGETLPDPLEAVAAAIPALRACERRQTWSSAFPRATDDLPVVGRVPGVEGAIVATGHGANGVLLSALTGSGLVELLVEGQLPSELEPFTPERFSDG